MVSDILRKHKMKNIKNKFGFTLTELVIVVSILWILSGISYLSYQWYVGNARDGKRMSDISVLKSAAIIYQKSHDWLFPNNLNSAYWYVYSWSLSNKIASQWWASDSFTARIGLSQRITDPSSNFPYIYSVSADRRAFQFSATLEASDKVAYNLDNPLIEKACASWDCDTLVAYVDGNFIPSNIRNLPSLTYAFNYWKINLDIADSSNLSKAVLNKQWINLAYNYNNEPMTCSWDIFSVNIWTNSWTIQEWVPCLNSVWVYIPHGTNEVINLNGTTLNTQMWWKYKVCNNWVMDKNWVGATWDSDYYYSCKDLWFWAQFDEKCNWLWCASWYSVNNSTPWCIEDMWWVTLASPQNWAYWIPTNGFLSWYPAKNLDSSWYYKVYLGSANNMFEIINWTSTTDTSVAFWWLNTSKMYFWKVQACDSEWNCKDSAVYSFTTSWDWTSSSSPSDWTSTTTTSLWNTYCPAWVICRADELVISYIWCNPWNSSYNDCKKDDFWTSERDGNYYYWKTKTLWYKLSNNSDWIVKFKVQLWWTWSLSEKWSSTGYDDSTAIDLWWDNLSNNLYWNAGAWCSWDVSSWYYVNPKTACFINVYFRWDPFVTFTNTSIAKIKFINNDTINSDWPDTEIPFKWNAGWYATWIPLIVTTLATKYKQIWEPTEDTITQYDFDESTIMSWSLYGYWKALTFNIANPNSTDSYFKPYFLDKTWNKYVVDMVNSSAWSNADFSWSGKSIDLLNNWIGNFYRNNWDFTLTSPCGSYNRLMKVSWSSSCKITVFYRWDVAISTKRSNFIDFKLFYQPIADQSVIATTNLYSKKSWWYTTLFTGFFPYSYNWWWMDFSTFKVEEDLNPKGFIWSKTMWWIDMNWSQTGSTIELYFDWTKKRIKWKTYSQTAWWIDFNKTNDLSTQTYIDNTNWKLHWWARSDNYWWVSFDNWINQ